jgi:hypothetical protein
MILKLDKKRLAEIFEKTVDPNLLHEESDDDQGADHQHMHDIGPVQP